MPDRVKVAFPTGQDSATFRDNGTEVPSLSRDKGTSWKFCQGPGTGLDSLSKSGMGRGTGRYQILTACPFPSCGTKRDSRKGRSKTGKGHSETEKDIPKQERMVLKRKSGHFFWIFLVQFDEKKIILSRGGTFKLTKLQCTKSYFFHLSCPWSFPLLP